MTANLKKISECKREIEVEIPADRVTEELNRVISDFSRKAKIPGFRPGKAPKDLVKQRYYHDIKETLINYLVPEALSDELKAQNLNPVDSPVLKDISFEEGEPLRFQASFEIWADFSLPAYKNIPLKTKKISVTNKEVDSALENLQNRAAQYEPVEGRGVLEGDYVVAEIGSTELGTKKTTPMEKVVILAGHPENEKALNENILELGAGDEKTFIANYEKDHHNPSLAGKQLKYTLKVESIKEKKIPEIDDDFAKDMGEFKGLEELKKHVRKDIRDAKEKAQRREMADEAVKTLVDGLDFEIPETAIEQETLNILRRVLSSQPQQDFKKEDIEKLRPEARGQAERNLRNQLVLTKIADEENIRVLEEEITDELKTLAKTNNVPLSQVVERVNQEGRKEELRENLRLQKTVDFLLDNAILN